MTDVNSLNYSEQGGAAWVVGGSLTITGTLDTTAAAATPGAIRVVAEPLAAVGTAGGVLAWENPEADAIMVHSLILDIRTASTGASTIDAGVAADGTTLSDTLIDGGNSNAIGVLNSANGGTNGRMARKVAAGEFVTISQASGDVTGLIGTAYISYSVI